MFGGVAKDGHCHLEESGSRCVVLGKKNGRFDAEVAT